MILILLVTESKVIQNKKENVSKPHYEQTSEVQKVCHKVCKNLLWQIFQMLCWQYCKSVVPE